MTSPKKILLTGGAGFIGKNILEQLSDSFDITAPSHKELDLLDARQTKVFFQSRHFDVVVHTAAAGVSRAQKNLSLVYKTNTEMFLNLASCSKSWGRLINLGSGAEYDKSQSLVLVTEDQFGQAEPKDDYGRAKYFISEQIQKSERMMSLRCFGVFGKYEDYTTRFISNSICRALAGLPIVMGQNRVFDYLYVNDLVSIIAYFIDHEPKEKFYNASRGKGIELLALAEMIRQVTATTLEIQIKNSGLGPEYSGDNTLLLEEIKNLEFTPLDTAIKELSRWYKNNWNIIDVNKLNFDA